MSPSLSIDCNQCQRDKNQKCEPIKNQVSGPFFSLSNKQLPHPWQNPQLTFGWGAASLVMPFPSVIEIVIEID